jgi:hypothetical protein
MTDAKTVWSHIEKTIKVSKYLDQLDREVF